jgi:hypothetical protein
MMDTGKALEIVHAMATSLLNRHGEFLASNPAEAREALAVVEDLIVNNFEVEEDELTAPFGKE